MRRAGFKCPDCGRRARFLYGTPSGTVNPDRHVCADCKRGLGEETVGQALKRLNDARANARVRS